MIIWNPWHGCRHYKWVIKQSEQCRKHEVTFDFIETGTIFVKNGVTYRIPDKLKSTNHFFENIVKLVAIG